MPQRRQIGLNMILAALALLMALLAALAGSPSRKTAQDKTLPGSDIAYMEPEILAEWLMAKRGDFLLLDLRHADDFARYRLPFAVNVPLENLNAEDLAGAERIVAYLGDDQVPAGVIAAFQGTRDAEIHWLRGGLELWAEIVLFPDLRAAGLSEEENDRISRRSRYFGGEPKLPPENDRPTPGVYLREGC